MRNQAVRFVGMARRAVLAGACAVTGLLGLAPAAHAAAVDLTVAIAVPTSTTLVPFAYTVVVGNAQTGTTASGAQLSIPLPANLYNVSVQGVAPSNGASCPAPADFAGVPPAGTTTTGAQTLTATVPSLPAAAQCTVTLAVTPLQANSYHVTAAIAVGGADTEVNASTNTASGNTATALSAVALKVDKTIVSGATRVSGSSSDWNAINYGTPVTYAVTFENQSDLPLPVGAMGDSWADWEGNWSPQSAPMSSTLTGGSCAATDLAGAANGAVCPPVSFATPGSGTDVTPFTADLSGYVLPPRTRITIRYTREYAAPTCGAAWIANDITWGVNVIGNFITPQWQANSFTTGGNSRITLHFRNAGNPALACIELAVNPVLTKTLDAVTSSGGSVRPAFSVVADGDVARFTITIDNTGTDPSTWPPAALAAGAAAVPFSVWDVVRSVLGTSVSPTVFPDGAITQEIVYDGCSAGAGSSCPAVASGTVLKAASTDFNHGQYAVLGVAAGETMTLRISTRYRFTQSVTCVRNNAAIENFIGLTVRAAPRGYAYTGTTYQEVVTTGKVSILPALPRCTDVSANKTMSPVNPQSGTPITFTLDYINSTALATANPYNAPTPLTSVGVSDVLGANFNATAVSCRVLTAAGTADAPAASLADITGPDHTFAVAIPRMDDGAIVRCEITGNVDLPGSYRNVTAVALAPSSGLVDPYTSNNISALNYGIIGPRVELTKTGSVTGTTATFIVTAHSRGEVAANGTRVTDPVPAGLANMQWTCAAADGAQCPAARGTGRIDATLEVFPPGGSVTWTITGTLPPSTTPLTNQARADLLPGASCVSADPTAAPTASPCLAQATVTLPMVSTSTAFDAGALVTPNGAVGYTATFNNSGAVAADGSQIDDPMPVGVASQTWTCLASGGAVCPAISGSGAITGAVVTFPAGGSLLYTVTATLNAAPPATLVNNSSISPPAGGICANGTNPPCTARAAIGAGAAAGGIAAVPIDAPWALAMLMVLIGCGAAHRRRR